jgi:hypothetical protein
MIVSKNLQIVSLLSHESSFGRLFYFFSEVIVMKIRDILNSDTKEALNKKARRRRKKNKAKKDPLKKSYSEREIKSLMWDGQTYERRGGAIRRK